MVRGMTRAATPLLKFHRPEDGGQGYLEMAGLNKLMEVAMAVTVVAFMGTGRSGKSYLANGFASALESQSLARERSNMRFNVSASSDPVTLGVDMLVVPLENRSVVILDCEGSDNAQSTQDGSFLASVVGLIGASQVVYVTSGNSLSQGFVDSLGRALAGRTVLPPVTLGNDTTAALPLPDLRVVQNMKLPFMQAADLDKALAPRDRDDGKNHLRDFINGSVASRRMFDLPVFGPISGPDSPEWVALLGALVAGTEEPLRVGGVPVVGRVLASLFNTTFEAAKKGASVHAPTVLRDVVLDGFVAPLVARLASDYKNQTPALGALAEYPPGLQDSRRAAALAEFDAATSHITVLALVEEARQDLQGQLAAHWARVVALANLTTRLVAKYVDLSPAPRLGGDFRPGLADEHRQDIEAEFQELAEPMKDMPTRVAEAREALCAQMDQQWRLVEQGNEDVGWEVESTDLEREEVQIAMDAWAVETFVRKVTQYKNGERQEGEWHIEEKGWCAIC